LLDRMDNTYMRNKEGEVRFASMNTTMNQLLEGMITIRAKLEALGK
jgi:hypothetical protein